MRGRSARWPDRGSVPANVPAIKQRNRVAVDFVRDDAIDVVLEIDGRHRQS